MNSGRLVPTLLFAGYAAVCLFGGGPFPFARYDMYAGASADIRIILVRADGEPLELTELAAFSPGSELLESEAVELAKVRAYLQSRSAARGASPLEAGQAFLDVETGLGRNPSVHEQLLRFARWRWSPPVLDPRPSLVEITEERVSYDRAGRSLKRTSRPLWRGTAHRIR